MKHIFTIHSSITFLVSYATIKHLNINQKDVIIISDNFEVPIDHYHVIPSFYESRNKTILQKALYFNVPKAFDNYVSEHLGDEDFIAYVDLMSYYQKILITHKRCLSFNFLEEGNSAYKVSDNLMDIIWDERKSEWRSNCFQIKSLIRVLRGYNLKLLGLSYIYSTYAFMDETKFYSFSKNAFYNAAAGKKVILKPDQDDECITQLSSGCAYDKATIWLDGSNARYTGLDESNYHNAIQKAIPILQNRDVITNKVLVKLRPGLENVSENPLISILERHGIIVEVMPSNVFLETCFIRSKNCNVIGVLTAALEYAHVFGHNAFSIYGLFEEQPPTIFDRMLGFWENVENLKNT